MDTNRGRFPCCISGCENTVIRIKYQFCWACWQQYKPIVTSSAINAPEWRWLVFLIKEQKALVYSETRCPRPRVVSLDYLAERIGDIDLLLRRDG